MPLGEQWWNILNNSCHRFVNDQALIDFSAKVLEKLGWTKLHSLDTGALGEDSKNISIFIIQLTLTRLQVPIVLEATGLGTQCWWTWGDRIWLGEKVLGTQGNGGKSRLIQIYCGWKKSGVHQLRLVVYPIIYRVLYISGGAGFLPSTVWWMRRWMNFLAVTRYSMSLLFQSPKETGHFPPARETLSFSVAVFLRPKRRYSPIFPKCLLSHEGQLPRAAVFPAGLGHRDVWILIGL